MRSPGLPGSVEDLWSTPVSVMALALVEVLLVNASRAKASSKYLSFSFRVLHVPRGSTRLFFAPSRASLALTSLVPLLLPAPPSTRRCCCALAARWAFSAAPATRCRRRVLVPRQHVRRRQLPCPLLPLRAVLLALGGGSEIRLKCPAACASFPRAAVDSSGSHVECTHSASFHPGRRHSAPPASSCRASAALRRCLCSGDSRTPAGTTVPQRDPGRLCPSGRPRGGAPRRPGRPSAARTATGRARPSGAPSSKMPRPRAAISLSAARYVLGSWPGAVACRAGRPGPPRAAGAPPVDASRVAAAKSRRRRPPPRAARPGAPQSGRNAARRRERAPERGSPARASTAARG